MEKVNKEEIPYDQNMVNQNLVKTGIIGGITLATYGIIGGIEGLIPEGTIRDVIDITQTIATTAVPVVLAETCMKGEGDYAPLRFAIQAIACGCGLHELLEDMGNLVNASSAYFETLHNNEAYIKAIGGALTFIKPIRDELKTGYPPSSNL